MCAAASTMPAPSSCRCISPRRTGLGGPAGRSGLTRTARSVPLRRRQPEEVRRDRGRSTRPSGRVLGALDTTGRARYPRGLHQRQRRRALLQDPALHRPEDRVARRRPARADAVALAGAAAAPGTGAGHHQHGLAAHPAGPPAARPIRTGPAMARTSCRCWKDAPPCMRARSTGATSPGPARRARRRLEVPEDQRQRLPVRCRRGRKRERANLRDKHPEVFARLQRQWEDWNAGFLPITDAVHPRAHA